MKKVLHAVFALALIFSVSFSSSAQMADGSFVPNVQFTDLDGNEYDLYEMLDDGKVVVLDLFAVWCGPCWNYAQGGALDDFYETYGPEGTDEVRVFGIEADPSTPEANILSGGGNSIGDWSTVMHYPLGNDDDIADELELAYYPTIYTIYPNRQIYESSQISAAGHYGYVETAAIATTDNDAFAVNYTGDMLSCGGAQAEVKVVIQNLGLTEMTSATITVSGDADLNYEWTGSLGTYDYEEVSVGMVDVPNDIDFAVEVTTDGDSDSGNNNVYGSVERANEATTRIRVEIQTDNWPVETTWSLFDENGTEVASGGPYGTNPNGEDPVTVWEEHWVPATGCYTFEMYDDYGDGMHGAQWGLTDGNYTVSSIDDNDDVWSVIATYDGSYNFDEIASPFESTTVVGVEEAELVSEFVVYPNPTNDVANVFYTLAEASDVSVVVFNTLGKVVYNADLGTVSTGINNLEVNFAGMEAGLYFINLTANDRVVTKKVTVTK